MVRKDYYLLASNFNIRNKTELSTLYKTDIFFFFFSPPFSFFFFYVSHSEGPVKPWNILSMKNVNWM